MAEIDAQGGSRELKQLVLAEIIRKPGSTTHEIGSHIGKYPDSVHLAAQSLIRAGQAREDRPLGKPARYYPVKKASASKPALLTLEPQKARGPAVSELAQKILKVISNHFNGYLEDPKGGLAEVIQRRIPKAKKREVDEQIRWLFAHSFVNVRSDRYYIYKCSLTEIGERLAQSSTVVIPHAPVRFKTLGSGPSVAAEPAPPPPPPKPPLSTSDLQLMAALHIDFGGEIQDKSGLAVAPLRDRLGLTTTAMKIPVNRLWAKGLLRLERNGKRTRLIKLTAEGVKVARSEEARQAYGLLPSFRSMAQPGDASTTKGKGEIARTSTGRSKPKKPSVSTATKFANPVANLIATCFGSSMKLRIANQYVAFVLHLMQNGERVTVPEGTTAYGLVSAATGIPLVDCHMRLQRLLEKGIVQYEKAGDVTELVLEPEFVAELRAVWVRPAIKSEPANIAKTVGNELRALVYLHILDRERDTQDQIAMAIGTSLDDVQQNVVPSLVQQGFVRIDDRDEAVELTTKGRRRVYLDTDALKRIIKELQAAGFVD